MAEEQKNDTPHATRLLSCYFKATDGGLSSASIMLCEVIGDEIQSVSLRVAADAMTHWKKQGEA